MTLASAGHPQALRQSLNSHLRYLPVGGFPLGLFEDASYDNVSVQLQAGEKLVLYSDGIPDCEDPNGDLFGGERLYAYVYRHGRKGPARLVDGLRNALSRWRQSSLPADDQSLLVLSLHEPGLEF